MTIEPTLPPGIRVTESMTTPSRPGKRPRPVWVVTGPTQGYEEALREAGGRKYNGAWSFFTDPTDTLARSMSQGKMSFADRQEAERERHQDRAERFAGYADNAAARSTSAFERAHRIGDAIPLGQPILVGHYSEGRHRRDLGRIDSAMRTSIDDGKKADYWEGRVKSSTRATAEPNLAFCGARLKDCEVRLRDIDRRLKGTSCSDAPAQGPYRDQLLASQAEQAERAAYWKGKIDALGGVNFSKANVTRGMRVKLVRWGWVTVDRANPTTVTYTQHGITLKAPYPHITEARPAPGAPEGDSP